MARLKKVFLSTTLFCICCFSIEAQITFSGQIIPLSPAAKAALEAWQSDRWQPIAEMPLATDGTFSSAFSGLKAGQYRLRALGVADHWVDFILPDSLPAALTLHFDLDFNKMEGQSVRLAGLPENNLYVDLMEAHQQLMQRRDSSDLFSANQMDAEQSEFNHRCREVAKSHPHTFLADVALLLIEPVRTDYPNNVALAHMTANEFAKARALESIPFHHEHILAHNAFIKSLNRYFKYFDRDTVGNKAFVEGVMSRRNGNDAVDAFLFKYLVDKMIDYRQEDGLSYLLSWYAPDCTDENPLPNNVQSLLEALKNATPGKVAADLTLPGLDGKPVKLSDVCAQHPLTLMLFWRSTCSHCRDFEPELVKIYEKYHPLGLEVYALSSDRDEQDWRGFLQQTPTPWVNVFIPQEQRGTIARQFPAPSTPTLISLDRQHRVVSRLISRSALESYLDVELKKRKEQK